MQLINLLMNRLFDFFLLPFRSLSAWVGLIFISLLTGLLMLFIFRWTSNQTGIRKVKDKIKAHLLELRLFKDSMEVTLKAQGQILRANLRYIAFSAKPMLVMIIPLLLILSQLNAWFGYRALNVGEAALLKVRLEAEMNLLELEWSLDTPPAVAVETPPLRIEQDREVDWRIRAQEAGQFNITIKMGGQSVSKAVIIAGSRLSRISPLRVKRSLWGEFLNPGEKPLTASSPVKSIEVTYPARRMNLLGVRLHWLIAYFALSIIFGFALKRPFRVEI
jgi:uncharacterized membrane protein (DUF106 family)